MKCKLSKLFFLMLIGAVSVKGYSQTEQERKEIVKGYDLKKLQELSEKFRAEAEASYAKALEIAKEKNLPISGVRENGAYFELKGVDAETGELTYFTTYNNGTTNSSVQTARTQNLYNNVETWGTNITGQGINIGIWDGGQPQASHQNLGLDRVSNKDNQFTTSSGQEGIDHATHVAGTMMGSGLNQIAARGLAYGAGLWANTWDLDLSEMTDEAAAGLLVSNHSYGQTNDSYVTNPGVLGRYTQEARDLDNMLFDAPKYLPSFAAGNDRGGVNNDPSKKLNAAKNEFDTLKHDAVAKNAVTVAAIQGVTDYAAVTPSSIVAAGFSQFGPTDDFRIKPDISAKGVAVYSSAMPEAISVNIYRSYQGTSMAAPAVTAVFALWQQYARFLWPLGFSGQSLQDRYMRSATVKALMAHTANDIDGVGPDPRTGWGIINAEGGAKVMKDASENKAVLKELELTSGQTYELDVVIGNANPQALIATIAWTDRAGNVVNSTDSQNSVLVNDLDLRVVRPNGIEMKPWSLPKGNYVLTGNAAVTDQDNNVDTIEKIQFSYSNALGALPGTYKIRVTHKGNSLVGGSQKFSLVVSGDIVEFDVPASTDKMKIEDLKIYPNPATDVLNISAELSSIENAQVAIFDILGKKVFESDSLFTFSGDATVDVSNLTAGVYLVQIVKNNKIDTRKIVIK